MNAERLEANNRRREKAQKQVTMRDNYSDGPEALSEIMDRKRERVQQFQQSKMADYRERFALSFDECASMNFADAAYRDAIASGKMKGEFAGPNKSFPIASPEDVRNAWMSAGRGKQDPKTTQKNILRIAKKYNWTSGLPKAVRNRMKKGGSGMPESD